MMQLHVQPVLVSLLPTLSYAALIYLFAVAYLVVAGPLFQCGRAVHAARRGWVEGFTRRQTYTSMCALRRGSSLSRVLVACLLLSWLCPSTAASDSLHVDTPFATALPGTSSSFALWPDFHDFICLSSLPYHRLSFHVRVGRAWVPWTSADTVRLTGGAGLYLAGSLLSPAMIALFSARWMV